MSDLSDELGWLRRKKPRWISGAEEMGESSESSGWQQTQSGEWQCEKQKRFQQCIAMWSRTQDHRQQAIDQFEEGTVAVWGQERVVRFDWEKLSQVFDSGVRVPSSVRDLDLRFVGGHKKNARRLARDINVRAGYFCDCSSSNCRLAEYSAWSDLGDDADTDDFSISPTSINHRCCRTLSWRPLPRIQEDGHFEFVYPTLKSTELKDAWERGVVNMRWKCWACLAHSMGTSYLALATIQHDSQFTEVRIASLFRQTKQIAEMRTCETMSVNSVPTISSSLRIM